MSPEPGSEGPADPADVVRTCLARLRDGDARGAVALLDPAVEWRNSGLPTLRGRRAHRAFLALEARGIDFDVTIHHLAVAEDDPGVVLTDRTDVLGHGRYRVPFWVCGTFVVRSGRIVLWDDHFSARNVLAGAVRGLVGVVGSVGSG